MNSPFRNKCGLRSGCISEVGLGLANLNFAVCLRARAHCDDQIVREEADSFEAIVGEEGDVEEAVEDVDVLARGGVRAGCVLRW